MTDTVKLRQLVVEVEDLTLAFMRHEALRDRDHAALAIIDIEMRRRAQARPAATADTAE
jgi:hypothetical protein